MAHASIPINKGNYSLETRQREEAFHRNLGAGWLGKYKLYRENWQKYPQRQFVSDYPLLVDLELSTVCNLSCPMCYTITDKFKRKSKVKFMDYGLFCRIIDEISGKVPAIRLSLRGEPTLHPRFLDCIIYAKEKGIGEVSALTNGSKLTKGFSKRIMRAGMDWLTISVDGLGKVYENIRKPLKFKDTLRKIKDFKVLKKKAKTNKPVIKIQSVWPAIRHDPQEFYNTFFKYTDLIAFNPLIDYLGKDGDILYDLNFICPQHYQRLVIGSDGKALICANDEYGANIIGDADKESIYEIWHGKKLSKIRAIFKKNNGFMRFPICKECYLPRLTDESERVKIKGREVIIKNYLGRKQRVGQ
ncbi:MAG: SPASM domain-containing protein [Candidatus Omnitrophota bacterium]|nr:SPASM domain-containing protein [Candidatus Omnitrophota bacterium]